MADRSGKTEAPTPKRKRESRKKGQVPRTPDLVGWGQVLLIAVLAKPVFRSVSTALTGVLQNVGRFAEKPDEREVVTLLAHSVGEGVLAIAPALGGLLLVVIIGNVVQTGFLVSPSLLKPKFERINPVKGFKRLVSPQSLWEAFKVLSRMAVLAAVAVPSVLGLGQAMASTGGGTVSELVAAIGKSAIELVRNVAAAGLVLAAADYAFQRRRVLGGQKMTKQEVKDENRQSEGDPYIKAEIRARQHAMSRNRMMAEVGRATAVVVNPTHYAVALRYAPGDPAPTVVAKGKGAVALRIREEAEHHGVPVMRDVPLARALHASCELGDIVPIELYEAVARLLALVFSLGRRGMPTGWRTSGASPRPPVGAGAR